MIKETRRCIRIFHKRGKIIEVAADLFCEKSYTGTSVGDISKALDMNIAMIYYYFKNKEDLLLTVIESIGNELLLNINKVIEESNDPLERLRNMLIIHICMPREKKEMG